MSSLIVLAVEKWNVKSYLITLLNQPNSLITFPKKEVMAVGHHPPVCYPSLYSNSNIFKMNGPPVKFSNFLAYALMQFGHDSSHYPGAHSCVVRLFGHTVKSCKIKL